MKSLTGFLLWGSLVIAFVGGCVARPPAALDEGQLSAEQRELVGKKLHWQLFQMPSDREEISHLHCVFCTAQMVEADGRSGRKGETDGYTTDDRHLWVCNRCFDRLNPQFHWIEK